MKSDGDVILTSGNEVMTSRRDVEDVPGVKDDDAKSLDDYYTRDDDTNSHDQYEYYDDDNDDDKLVADTRSLPEFRLYYPQPDHYPEETYNEPQVYYQPPKKRKKKVYVPVFVPEKEKKKS